jgi:hypothetical protein
VAILCLVLVVAWLRWVVPSTKERNEAFASACADAARLHNVGLLDEARHAYERIADVHPTPSCLDQRWTVEADDDASAAAAERGSVYFRAAHLKRNESTRNGRHLALARARSAYIEALAIDPFARDARRKLDELIAGMGGPTKTDGANRRCAFAGQLRTARLLYEAQLAYAQALRTGRTTSCVRSGVRDLRQDRATAQRIFLAGRALQEAGKPEDARPRYTAAIAWDPMLTGARSALDGTDAPDPRDGTTFGHFGDIAGSAKSTVTDMGGFAGWLTDNGGAFGLGAVALLLVVLPALMWLLYWITVRPRGRRLVDLVHLPRFARRQLIVAGFTPTEQAGTSEALFVHWLGRGLADPEAGAEETVAASYDTLTDLWEAPRAPERPFVDAATLLGATGSSGMVGAALKLAQAIAPRREVRFYGQLLDRSEHGPGLRVTIDSTRPRRPPRDRIWWGVELPSAPTQADAETDARHALAIVAATWAHEEVRD